MGLSYTELLSQLGLANTKTRLIDGVTDEAYRVSEEKYWKRGLASTRGRSFHMATFPGDDPKACGRYAVYTLLDLPKSEPIDRRGLAIMDAGKDLEQRIVKRWHNAGILLSEPPWSKKQTQFIDLEHWMSGYADGVIRLEDRPHPVEIKGKDHDVIMQMIRRERSFDLPHKHQIKTYIGMAHELQPFYWPQLHEVRDGTLYYVSRQRPSDTFEYLFDYDAEFMRVGRAKLTKWRGLFVKGELPPRPKEWRWGEPPCRWCELKKQCKADIRADVTDLSESHVVKRAKEIVPTWKYEKAHQATIDRWET